MGIAGLSVVRLHSVHHLPVSKPSLIYFQCSTMELTEDCHAAESIRTLCIGHPRREPCHSLMDATGILYDLATEMLLRMGTPRLTYKATSHLVTVGSPFPSLGCYSSSYLVRQTFFKFVVSVPDASTPTVPRKQRILSSHPW
jgi:hypothetical protein